MRVFVSTPITGLRVRMTDAEWDVYCATVKRLLTRLRKFARVDIFCALEVEEWGGNVPTPGAALQRDFGEMQRADLVVCLYSAEVVSSILIELGWAWCLDIPMILGTKPDVRLPMLLEGFASQGRLTVVREQQGDPLISAITRAVQHRPIS